MTLKSRQQASKSVVVETEQAPKPSSINILPSSEVLKLILQQDEGREKKPYVCSAGKQTIGIGWNLTDNGLPDDIVDMLYVRSINSATASASRVFGKETLASCGSVRRIALICMAFNIGESRLRKFVKMMAAIQARDWPRAAKEARSSLWANQVKGRADRIAEMIEHDKIPGYYRCGVTVSD